jgi:hypothetical protein
VNAHPAGPSARTYSSPDAVFRRGLLDIGSQLTIPDAGAPPNVTYVRTAQQLQDAFVAGARDIELRDHVDLTTLLLRKSNYSRWGVWSEALGLIASSTRSIRVRLRPSNNVFGHACCLIKYLLRAT